MIEHHAPGMTSQAVVKEGKVTDRWVWQEASTPERPIDSLLKFCLGLVL